MKLKFPVVGTLILFAVALVSVLFAASCGGGATATAVPKVAEEAREAAAQAAEAAGDVEVAVRAVADDWNGKDSEAFLGRFTDKGFQESFDATKDEGRQFLPEFIGDPALTIRELSNTKVNGNTATIEVEVAFGIAIDASRFSMVKGGEAWKIDGEELLSNPTIPNGVTAVNVVLAEFAFGFDSSAVTGGNVGFILENVGQQEHEFFVARAPEGPPLFDLLELIETEGGGVEPLGGITVEPGKKRNLAFTEALSPGRYIVVCFLPDVNDPEGTPHIFKGMLAEFTVQ